MNNTKNNQVLIKGEPITATGKALIMVHGRGASASSILSLSEELDVADFTIYVPQASQNSWYPYSFMAPVAQNQPALDVALHTLDKIVKSIQEQNISSKNIYLLGFSQGACLTAEYTTRYAQPFGGIILFTGGLIGEVLNTSQYNGDFESTPVFISTGDPDSHVPVSRVEETVKIMENRGAIVTKKIFANRPHTILQEEINFAKHILGKSPQFSKRHNLKSI